MSIKNSLLVVTLAGIAVVYFWSMFCLCCYCCISGFTNVFVSSLSFLHGDQSTDILESACSQALVLWILSSNFWILFSYSICWPDVSLSSCLFTYHSIILDDLPHSSQWFCWLHFGTHISWQTRRGAHAYYQLSWREGISLQVRAGAEETFRFTITGGSLLCFVRPCVWLWYFLWIFDLRKKQHHIH